MKIYCDPSNRHDFVFLFDVTNGNPNGDPDAGNLPRVDAETNCGIVTDVCIKRKVRDYVQSALGRDIYIQGETALNMLYLKALRETNLCRPAILKLTEHEELKKFLEDQNIEFDEWLGSVEAEDFEYDPTTREVTYSGEDKRANAIRQRLMSETEIGKETPLGKAINVFIGKLAEASKGVRVPRQARETAREDMRDKFWDVRMFGAVLTGGTNAGQIRGPMQLTFATSVDPVVPRDITITRVAITKASDMLRKRTEMGRKAYVPYGLYRLHGFYNPLLAARVNGNGERSQVVTELDLTEFWEALEKMFWFDRSAARAEMRSRGLYIFTHGNEKGNAASHKLFDLVKIKSRGDWMARSYEDYGESISIPPDGELAEFPGVTFTRLIHG